MGVLQKDNLSCSRDGDCAENLCAASEITHLTNKSIHGQLSSEPFSPSLALRYTTKDYNIRAPEFYSVFERMKGDIRLTQVDRFLIVMFPNTYISNMLCNVHFELGLSLKVMDSTMP
jgi:hypothetical protein